MDGRSSRSRNEGSPPATSNEGSPKAGTSSWTGEDGHPSDVRSEGAGYFDQMGQGNSTPIGRASDLGVDTVDSDSAIAIASSMHVVPSD